MWRVVCAAYRCRAVPAPTAAPTLTLPMRCRLSANTSGTSFSAASAINTSAGHVADAAPPGASLPSSGPPPSPPSVAPAIGVGSATSWLMLGASRTSLALRVLIAFSTCSRKGQRAHKLMVQLFPGGG